MYTDSVSVSAKLSAFHSPSVEGANDKQAPLLEDTDKDSPAFF